MKLLIPACRPDPVHLVCAPLVPAVGSREALLMPMMRNGPRHLTWEQTASQLGNQNDTAGTGEVSQLGSRRGTLIKEVGSCKDRFLALCYFTFFIKHKIIRQLGSNVRDWQGKKRTGCSWRAAWYAESKQTDSVSIWPPIIKPA